MKKMTLVGAVQFNPRLDNDEFYRDVFSRLPKEVKGLGSETRFVIYESPPGTVNPHLRFVGIETDRLVNIPEGMWAWELTESRWRVLIPDDDEIVVHHDVPVRWRWRLEDRTRSARVLGEFGATVPDGWGTRPRDEFDFGISGLAPIIPTRPAPADQVELVPYDPQWPEQYESMARWLRRELRLPGSVHMEHIGSTAIPGMDAKPVIDILIEVSSYADARRRILPVLSTGVWEFWWYDEHMLLVRRDGPMGPRTHHVHFVHRGHRRWDAVRFRDYLSEHADAAEQYLRLKRRLSMRNRNDREAYTRAKSPFIEDIARRVAKQEADRERIERGDWHPAHAAPPIHRKPLWKTEPGDEDSED